MSKLPGTGAAGWGVGCVAHVVRGKEYGFIFAGATSRYPDCRNAVVTQPLTAAYHLGRHKVNL